MVVFLERISGGDKEKVTSRDAGGRGASESVPRRRQSGDGRTEW